MQFDIIFNTPIKQVGENVVRVNLPDITGPIIAKETNDTLLRQLPEEEYDLLIDKVIHIVNRTLITSTLRVLPSHINMAPWHHPVITENLPK